MSPRHCRRSKGRTDLEVINYLFISGWAYGSAPGTLLFRSLGIEGTSLAIYEIWPDYKHKLSEWIAASDKPIVLMGWSMGGMIALEMACLFPDKIKALVLMASTLNFVGDSRGNSCAARQNMRRQSLKELRSLVKTDRFKGVRKFYELAGSTISSEDLESDDIRNGWTTSALLEGLDFLKEKELCAEISKLQIPILAIHGKKDRVIPYSASLDICSKRENCKVQLIDLAGHILHERAMTDVAEVVGKFLWDCFSTVP